MTWTIAQGMSRKGDSLASEIQQELESKHGILLRSALLWLLIGLILLILSSRMLVWGAVAIARRFGVDELFIGLTIVAVGTSLPELASSLIAARKGKHDIALGNILGSNLFNTLAVVSLADVVSPLEVGPEVFSRDILVMVTLSLLVLATASGAPAHQPRLSMVNMPPGSGFRGYTASRRFRTCRNCS